MGAAIGGAVGYFVFFWVVHQGFYGLIIPPGLLGLGAGLCARRRSQTLGIICGVAGLLLAIFTEWRFAPFIDDNSFLYMLTHLHQLRSITLIMMAIGTFVSYRLALGFDASSETTSKSTR
jgi:hypothetical protein